MNTQPELLFEAPREAPASVGESSEDSLPALADEQTGKPIPKASADNTGSSALPDLSRSRAARIVALASQGVLTDAERGELDILLDRHVDVASPSLLRWLYDPPPKGWGLTPRYIKENGRNTTRLSRGMDALLAAYRVKKDERLALVLRLLRLRAEAEALNLKVGP